MPPTTRSQTAQREVAAQDNELAPDAAPSDPTSKSARMRQEESNRNGPPETQKFATARAFESGSKTRLGMLDEPDEPPRFTIDLSLPPEQRYLAVCAAFQAEIAELVPLFDEVVGGMIPKLSLRWLHGICRLFLRGVYDKEENAELRGISKATSVSMYLLVCFNVLLDLFMGCSSGGAVVRHGEGSKMVHFRTLDWGMPSLRRVVVQLDFVLEKGGPVFASSITYAGYVGVLTGVREGVSMSLNFRPNRVDNGVFWSDVKYILHLLFVLLGWRRSISSTLRQFLLPRSRRRWWLPFSKFKQDSSTDLLDYAGIVKAMGGDEASKKRPRTTTACYLSFCNGKETTVIEKDRVSAKARSGDEFVVVTNTDESPPTTPEKPNPDSPADATITAKTFADLGEVMQEAKDRQECALHNWRNLQSRRARDSGVQYVDAEARKRLASAEDLIHLVQKYPTTNECTHFACVMDPGVRVDNGSGRVLWCRRWREPIGAAWIRSHMSTTW